MVTTLGNQGTSLILISRDRTATTTGTVIKEVYRCDQDEVDTLIGQFSFGEAHGDHARSFLTDVHDLHASEGFATVTLTYEPKDSSPKPPEVGDESFGGSTSVSEVPIDQHASYAETWKESKSGVESYFIAQSTFTRTTAIEADDWDWTESNLTSGVNQRGAPDGLSGATANNWLKISREPSQSGEIVVVTEEWLHNPEGWDTDLYS